jgi:hypothetical protein
LNCGLFFVYIVFPNLIVLGKDYSGQTGIKGPIQWNSIGQVKGELLCSSSVYSPFTCENITMTKDTDIKEHESLISMALETHLDPLETESTKFKLT